MHQTYTSNLITNYGKYPIVFQGVIIRNNLPTYIGIVILYNMFQNKLKKYVQNYDKVHSDFPHKVKNVSIKIRFLLKVTLLLYLESSEDYNQRA